MILLIVISSFTLSYCQTPSQDIVSANNLFTVSVYNEIAKKETGNILVSPFSAETVLALTQAGAEDETATEIREALHLRGNQKEIESGFKTLLSSLRNNEDYTLKTANKIYVQNDFQIKEEFKKVATKSFFAGLENIDFSQKDEAARIINSWVEENTEDKIHDLVSPDNLNDAIRLILINALYFQGNWSSPFDDHLTTKRDFYKTETEIIEVDTMRNTATYNYFVCDVLDAKFLKISFKGQDASMIFVLPNKIDGLSSLEMQLNRVFDAHKSNYTRTRVNVHLPKFKIEEKIDFKEILQNLGVRQAFNPNEADLSGIAGQKGDLVIDQVLQKTFINVNEAGVEAAAATSVGISVTSIIEEPPKDFNADHPFMFYIKVNELIIFAGRVVSPNV